MTKTTFKNVSLEELLLAFQNSKYFGIRRSEFAAGVVVANEAMCM